MACESCKEAKAANLMQKIFKSIFDPDASEELIRERLEICKNCTLRNHIQCTECGCLISLKVKLSSERCPMEKW